MPFNKDGENNDLVAHFGFDTSANNEQQSKGCVIEQSAVRK